MKHSWLAIIVSAAATQSVAAAATKPLADWTCADFVGTEDIVKPKIIYWAAGVAKAGEPKTATIDVVETDKIIPFISNDCQKDPQASFWQTLSTVWEKGEKTVESLEKKL